MFHKAKLILAFSVISGCSTTPEQLEASKSAHAETRGFSINYQELYRRVYGPASRCLKVSVGGGSQMIVEGQLYSELGFGEIVYSMHSMYGRNFYAKVKIEKVDSGSKMTVNYGNTFVNQSGSSKFFAWADGKTTC